MRLGNWLSAATAAGPGEGRAKGRGSGEEARRRCGAIWAPLFPVFFIRLLAPLRFASCREQSKQTNKLEALACEAERAARAELELHNKLSQSSELRLTFGREPASFALRRLAAARAGLERSTELKCSSA